VKSLDRAAITTVVRRGETSIRIGPWSDFPGVAQLVALPSPRPTEPDAIGAALDTAARLGFSHVRTGALGPGEIAPYTAHGFEVEATLVLLRHGLRDLVPRQETFRRARRSDWSTLAAIDDAAFPPYWHFDERSLRDAQGATPSSRTRVAGGRSPIGYAITGRTGSTGFVQRLAVHPSAMGRGIGRALTLDGLHWLRRRGSKQAFVNTQDDNERALALYLDLGFLAEPQPLLVLARTAGGAGR
jgi:GNAT superfamily N-acetyltransferase